MGMSMGRAATAGITAWVLLVIGEVLALVTVFALGVQGRRLDSPPATMTAARAITSTR